MIVFDIETQNLAKDVGGWHNKELLRLAVACTWSPDEGYMLWWESQAADLVNALQKADFIVGFNVNSFDYHVLNYYNRTEGLEDKTFDILDEVWKQTGRGRRGTNLNSLAKLNLGETKTGEGIDAVELWRTSRLEELAAYCQQDVELTKNLYEAWEANGLLWLNEIQYVIWPGNANIQEKKRHRR
jgi:DEAD/DEAH box helicase domain-containing protein